MVCSTADGEPLWAKLRPGNAAANDIGDHLEAVDAAVAMLPPADAAGHRDGDGDGDSLAERSLAVRIDAAGCSPALAAALADRSIGCVVSARKTPGVEAAVRSALGDPGLWHHASQRARRRKPERAQVADLAGWPEGTRLVVRREPRHPGAQRSLFPSDSFRYWGFLTD